MLLKIVRDKTATTDEEDFVTDPTTICSWCRKNPPRLRAQTCDSACANQQAAYVRMLRREQGYSRRSFKKTARKICPACSTEMRPQPGDVPSVFERRHACDLTCGKYLGAGGEPGKFDRNEWKWLKKYVKHPRIVDAHKPSPAVMLFRFMRGQWL